ncbi:MAG: TIGR03960 family B12-binding radical SAM protein [Pseudomonadota bacterium]
MNITNIQEILPFVELPSRYLGFETNTVHKDHRRVILTFALAFPDLYEIGTSHFGMQILYSLLNRHPAIAAERCFTPAPDMEGRLREKGMPLASLESQTPLGNFDIIGFSLLYELNFTNILTMLDLAGIPFYSDQRDHTHPLIIGGGPCTFNPEPLADFFDAMVIGDGEEVILELSEAVIDWKKSGDARKQTLLHRLARIRGIYVPSFYTPLTDAAGIQHLEPGFPEIGRVRRAIVPDLTPASLPATPVVPFGRPVHDRLRLEIARGCSRGCRFCQAGMIYRPVRERSVQDLVATAKTAVKATGYNDISLLSLSTGDYSNLGPLMTELLGINPNHCASLSLPSFRAGRLTPEMMAIIKTVKKTGFTIAPEAGTQRLRDVINKNITEQDIVDTVTNAFTLGWRAIKLYFMNGLPTETFEDIQAIATLSRKLAAIPCKGKGRSTISVSFAPFIPKPHTPFQRCAQISKEQAQENLNYLKQHLRHPGINLKWHNPEMSILEGVWSRGDRRLSRLLVTAWEKGCRLDGWTDMFRLDLWRQAFDETGIDPAFYTTRQRTRDEVLPWSHIDPGIDNTFLETEFDRAMTLTTTPDCRENGCMGCGICDFKTIKPVLYDPQPLSDGPAPGASIPEGKGAPGKEPPLAKFTVYYSRLGTARFLGHLELAKMIRRAIRRTGVRVKYSKGFSPVMKVSFDNPLPVGMESQEEFFNLQADAAWSPDDLARALGSLLPEMIPVTRCTLFTRPPKTSTPQAVTYRVTLHGHTLDMDLVRSFVDSSEHLVEQTSFKGQTRTMDLRKALRRIDILDSNQLEMVLISVGTRTVRPAEILTRIFNVPEETVQTAHILKLKQR